MDYTSMTTTVTQLVAAVRDGDSKAKEELERRAQVNGKHSRAAKALEGLETGGPATIGEFFAKAKTEPRAPRTRKAPRKTVKGASASWGYLTAPNGKEIAVDKLVDNLSTSVSAALRRSLLNALTK